MESLGASKMAKSCEDKPMEGGGDSTVATNASGGGDGGNNREDAAEEELGNCCAQCDTCEPLEQSKHFASSTTCPSCCSCYFHNPSADQTSSSSSPSHLSAAPSSAPSLASPSDLKKTVCYFKACQPFSFRPSCCPSFCASEHMQWDSQPTCGTFPLSSYSLSSFSATSAASSSFSSSSSSSPSTSNSSSYCCPCAVPIGGNAFDSSSPSSSSSSSSSSTSCSHPSPWPDPRSKCPTLWGFAREARRLTEEPFLCLFSPADIRLCVLS
eukprot:GHVT01068266.1.p2 GENE.GHVT01068266.1~~GHVT01068266.1.p2  ORF type:complete len:268 (-),score=94.37 GHVT01068266.1:568-1371(-)